MKIIIPFNGKPESEIEKIDGFFTALSWSSLKATISDFVRLRDDEIIDGLIVSETDVRVKISRKKGRKTATK